MYYIYYIYVCICIMYIYVCVCIHADRDIHLYCILRLHLMDRQVGEGSMINPASWHALWVRDLSNGFMEFNGKITNHRLV